MLHGILTAFRLLFCTKWFAFSTVRVSVNQVCKTLRNCTLPQSICPLSLLSIGISFIDPFVPNAFMLDKLLLTSLETGVVAKWRLLIMAHSLNSLYSLLLAACCLLPMPIVAARMCITPGQGGNDARFDLPCAESTRTTL